MSFANPTALWLAALAIPVVLLHVLRPRRARHEVRSVLLWQQVSSPVAAASPWQRLVPSTLLILQLLAVLLLAIAAARPVVVEETPLAAHTVFIIDASASMGAREGAGTRVDLAADAASELWDELPREGIVSVVEAGVSARVTLSATGDRDDFEAAVSAIEPSEGRGDLVGAFTLARSLETPGFPVGFVLLSDGGLDPVEQRQAPAGTRYVPIGRETTNRAITGLTVTPRGSGVHAVATVTHTGGAAATQTLRLDVDGRTMHEEAVRLEPDGVIEVAADLPAGRRIEAFLEGEDALDLDDHRYATAPPVEDLAVAVVGQGDPFLEILLDSLPGVTATPVPTAAAAPDADVVVFDRAPVPAGINQPHWAIAPPGGAPDVTVTGEVEAPAVALVDSRDPLLADLDLTELAIAGSQQVSAPLATELIGAEGTPLLLRGPGDVPSVYQTFALAGSNLPVQVAFPILGDRILRELAGPGSIGVPATVGDRLPQDIDRAGLVERPDGGRVERPVGSGAPVADRAGFWQVTVGDDDPVLVAVNPPAEESSLQVAPSLAIEERERPRGESVVGGESARSLLPWVVLPLLALLAAEAWVSRRRLGVGRRQWHLALAGRVAIAALVILALADFGVDRRAERVATVFVLDASDSLGRGGRQAALAWVHEALGHQPDGDLAGLVIFGGDAQLETTVRKKAPLSRPAVRVDPSRTDLAGALRLGAAVLPTDARRRIVVVSDGRATQGDTATEAERLAESGIAVDFHAVERAVGRDVAVSALELPGRVRQGERVTLTATVDATEATTARIDLLRDGVRVDGRTVELTPGANRVEFSDTAQGEGGVARYQIRVTSGGDTIAQNDVAFGAAQVEGPATVLVVEGRPGNGATLASALAAAGIDVRTVAVTDIPPVDELAGISSTVLVDVDARTLAPEHLQALTTATRDLGRGLVTIGGTQSYGLGGYRGSDLEALLPVESEILDPKRRQSVAEVLAIDTSGSMGACHCAEGNNGIVGGNSMQGGVNKTDISRAGAARAIEALSELDEVGVLAVDSRERWLIDLQQVPAQDVVTSGLRKLVPSGDTTDLSRSLRTSADALRDSKATLKHIILFTDGFTEPAELKGLAEEAAQLLEEGITVSVVGTGEGAAGELAAIAEAGRGRFYPGRDLQEVPEILADEAVLASRDFLQEGRFVPQVTSNADPVAGLTAAPPVLGYVATTARPLATTHLRVGEEGDPLLASWQVGLGRVTSWTSDLDRWAQTWSGWSGFVNHWAGVVKDTYPSGEQSGTVRARIDGDTLHIEVESADDFPGGVTGSARVVHPEGKVDEVRLTRSSGDRFTGEVTVSAAGSYAVGATVGSGDTVSVAGTTLTTRSYSAEYVPGEIDETALEAIAARTGGRGDISPSAAFDRDGLTAGQRRIDLGGWLLLAAALLWPVAVACSRLLLRGAALASTARTARAELTRRLRAALPDAPGRSGPARSRHPGERAATMNGPATVPPERPARAPVETPAPPPPDQKQAAPKSTLGSLLDARRARRDQG